METYERVRLLRKNLKLSQEQFGDKLGVSRSVIANIETNVLARPEQKEPLLRLICETFNVSYEWLTIGHGEMKQESDFEKISAVASEFQLDELSQIILKSYVALDSKKREGLNSFIQALTQSVLEENLVRAHSDIQNEIEHFGGDEEELHDRTHAIFATEFPFIEFNSTETPRLSVADKAIELVKTNQAADSTSGKEHGVVSETHGTITVEEERAALHTKMDEEFYEEKRRETKVSSAKESDVG